MNMRYLCHKLSDFFIFQNSKKYLNTAEPFELAEYQRSLLLKGVHQSLASFSADDCWSLGFNRANLLCSSCDSLKKFDLDIIQGHCQECCSKDETTPTIKRYAKARLEVCTCKFGAYPQIQAFVKSDRPAKFPNLSIRYVRGLDPIIKLMDKDSNVQEVLAIERWNTDSIEEFLNTHLEQKDINEDFLRTNLV